MSDEDDEMYDTVGTSIGGQDTDVDVWDFLEVYEAIEDGEWDEEKRDELMGDMDFEAMQKDIVSLVNEYLTPHINEIRETAARKRAEGVTRHKARAELESLPEEEQDEQLDQAIVDMVQIATYLANNDPDRAFGMLKDRMRSPWFMERLNLIFSNPHHIDSEYSEDMKELSTYAVRWVSMSLIPGMYTRDEQEEVLRQFYDEEQVQRILQQSEQYRP